MLVGIITVVAVAMWLRRTASAGDAMLVARTSVFTAKVRRGDLVRQAPAQGALYTAGTTVNFAGTGTDPEDGTLPASAFT